MTHATLTRIRSTALAALRPPPKLRLSEWIESTLRLPDNVSATPGPVRLWPFQRDIADAIGDPTIERVTLVKPVRVGLSTLLTGALASYVANDPAPILSLLPTEADCRDYVVSDVDPVFAATPAIAGLLAGDSDDAGRSTLLSRRFPGGSLKVVAAKSPRNLRRHNVRVLLMDEVDAMEPGAEGSPLILAERRTLSFDNRKIVCGSTPTNEDTSNVLRSYAASDQRIFEVPCPECGAFAEILWSMIEWVPDRPETAAFRCPHCRELIDESHKPQMVGAGAWRATRPEVTGHAGFRLNALISLLANASWAKLAAEFLQAKDSPDTLQVFTNTLLAQGWRDAGEELDESALASRAEPFGLTAIPSEVLIVTAGVDVQDDRLEIVFLGFGRDEIFALGQAVVWGSPLDNTTWLELEDLLRSAWPHPGGGTLRLDACLIDSGDGGATDAVYKFTHPRYGRRIAACKGAAGFSRPALQASASKGSKLFIVGVDALKSQLMNRLSRGQTIRFSGDLEPRFFEELTSERRVIRYLKGAPVRRFERIPGRRAEALDCVVYAMAARQLVGVSLDRRAEEVSSAAGMPPSRPAVIRSKWLGR